MYDLLARRERLAARLPEPIETDEEKGLADEMLSEASAEARLYGNQMWNADTVPSDVVTIVVKAAARGFMNPAGYTDEAADSTRLSRAGEYAQGAAFTPAEIRAVRGYAKRSGISYAQVTKPNDWAARSDRRTGGTIYAPVAYGGRPFPWVQGGGSL